MKRLTLYLLMSSLLFTGCEPKEEIAEPELVVEGWITSGGHPLVILHKSISFNESFESVASLVEDKLVPFGKVTIDDGTQKVVLTGRLDTNYIPPYRYSSVEIIGEERKTYSLTAEYENKILTAKTTIPPRAYIDSIQIKQKGENNDAMEMRAFISDDTNDPKYYVLFYRRLGTIQYYNTFLGVFDNSGAKEGILSIPIYYSVASGTIGQDKPILFFKKGMDLEFMLTRVDKASYDFWKTFSAISVSSGNAFLPIHGKIISNVSGGKGYWCGYGSSSYIVKLRNDTTLIFDHDNTKTDKYTSLSTKIPQKEQVQSEG